MRKENFINLLYEKSIKGCEEMRYFFDNLKVKIDKVLLYLLVSINASFLFVLSNDISYDYKKIAVIFILGNSFILIFLVYDLFCFGFKNGIINALPQRKICESWMFEYQNNDYNDNDIRLYKLSYIRASRKYLFEALKNYEKKYDYLKYRIIASATSFLIISIYFAIIIF